jgi:hypothetical protein
LFGAKDQGWINDKMTILDAVRQDAALLRQGLPKEDELRLDEHLSSIRDLERAIVSLPPEYSKVTEPEQDFDLKDWPRIAKLQSDLLAYALATGQTRGVLHASRGLATPPRGTMTTLTRTVRPLENVERKASASCAISAGGTSRNSPTWSPG